MPPSELSKIAKWPKVPACYDWLSLDRRGRWRLKGELIMHAGLIGFINTHYTGDESGHWFVQNGPQRVFVSLEYAPWVVRLEKNDGLSVHTGEAAGEPSAAFLDEEGNVLVQTASGLGLLDDRDLPAFLADCRHADGTPASEAAVLDAIAGDAGVLWRGLTLQAIQRAAVPKRFGFQPAPAP
jgi:hypothetical protein